MPPPAVKTVRDLIYWEYAKLIAERAVGSRRQWGFVMDRFRKLVEGRIKPSDIIRENKLLVESGKRCAYCGSERGLSWEHIIPLSLGGPDDIDNLVLACRGCNSSKGDRDPYAWYLAEYGERGKYRVPRLVAGKCLKLFYERAESIGLLDKPLIQIGVEDIEQLAAILYGYP
jgi:5-methylcytosine-specific restriction endonuclease McrA